MDPLPTLDALLANPKSDPDWLRRTAERAVAAAVSDWQAIRAFAGAAGGGSDARVFDRPVETAVRAQYQAWVAAAEGLTARVVAVAGRGGPVLGTDDLRHTIGKTMAQLSVSLASMEESARDVAEGRFVTAEEVRRELRLRAKV